MKTIIQCTYCEHIHVYDSQKYHSGQHVCPNCERWFMSDEIPEPMPVISVKQPWAWLLCSGIKNIENRTWRMPEKHKGKHVLIHAGAKNAPSFTFTYEQSRAIDHVSNDQEFLMSAIIGAVKLVTCGINHPSIWAEKSEGISEGRRVIDHTKPIIYNWLVSHPTLFEKPFLNVKGKLSFFYPEIK